MSNPGKDKPDITLTAAQVAEIEAACEELSYLVGMTGLVVIERQRGLLARIRRALKGG